MRLFAREQISGENRKGEKYDQDKCSAGNIDSFLTLYILQGLSITNFRTLVCLDKCSYLMAKKPYINYCTKTYLTNLSIYNSMLSAIFEIY